MTASSSMGGRSSCAILRNAPLHRASQNITAHKCSAERLSNVLHYSMTMNPITEIAVFVYNALRWHQTCLHAHRHQRYISTCNASQQCAAAHSGPSPSDRQH